ncbi:uncharacterized protein IWZ02DRAFT_302331 [Phyllosticta citriasiana]|uniref:uncharacterized protein n=1 Tax=Phyllosticta citriasiana TaxID=595635 RepID=UPI0030FD9646
MRGWGRRDSAAAFPTLVPVLPFCGLATLMTASDTLGGSFRYTSSPARRMRFPGALNRDTYPHSPFRPCQRNSNHSLSFMSELSTRPREGSRTLDRHTHIAQPGYIHPLIAAAPGHSWPLFS